MNTRHKEEFSGPLDLKFEMPVVRLISMKPDTSRMAELESSPVKRLLIRAVLATRRRKFVLENDFEFTVIRTSDSQLSEFVGTMVVPAMTNDQLNTFDGATIPVPWLVAALTGNALNPLGTVLIPSMIHDELFRAGGIQFKDRPQLSVFSRKLSDRFFLQSFKSISGLRIIPTIAWIVVRAGAAISIYNGKRGPLNVFALALLLVMVGLLLYGILSQSYGLLVFWAATFGLAFIDIYLDKVAAPYQSVTP